MKRIKFHSKDDNEKAFSKEVRKRVRSYFKENNISMHGNASMYLKTVVMLGIYITPFIIILTLPISHITALGMAVLMGIGEAGVGMSVMHDAAHGAYSSKTWVNTLVASTMFLLGSNTINWKIQHNINHHTFTNIYNYDPDISTKAVIRLCENAPLRKYHRFQQIYTFPLYGLMTLFKLFDDFFTLLHYNKNGVTKEQHANPTVEIIKLIVTKVIYFFTIIGLPLLLTDFSFWEVLIGFATLHITAGMVMSTVFQMAHVVEGTYQPVPDENNVIHHDWVVHQLLATSDFGKKNGIMSWFIGGLDFQIEHHLFSNVCHIHYSSIAPIVEATAKEYGYTYNTNGTFLHALSSHYRRLGELGRAKVS